MKSALHQSETGEIVSNSFDEKERRRDFFLLSGKLKQNVALIHVKLITCFDEKKILCPMFARYTYLFDENTFFQFIS